MNGQTHDYVSTALVAMMVIECWRDRPDEGLVFNGRIGPIARNKIRRQIADTLARQGWKVRVKFDNLLLSRLRHCTGVRIIAQSVSSAQP